MPTIDARQRDGELAEELVIASCRSLRDLGAEIVAVLCVIDRQSGGAAAIAAEGLDLRSAFTMTQVRAAAGT